MTAADRTGVVGVVGLGAMGAPIARRLAASGRTVLGCDPDPERRAAFESAVARPRELPAECTTYLLLLPDPPITLGAVFGEDGLAAGDLRAGDVVVNLGTIGPDAMVELGERLAAEGVDVLDAPMGKSSHDAERGTMSLMTAGPPALAEELGPMLSELASDITYCGELGLASTVKIVNNLVSGTTLAVVAEGLALGARAGLSLDVMIEVLSHTGADGAHLRRTFGERVRARDFAPGFSVDLAAKDLAIGVEIAARRDVPLPLVEQALRRYAAAQEAGLGGEDWGSLAKLAECDVGAELC
jgi:3-hydroxyisobutyrate dehydrogenase-like beta-hydroxyacid dehydrogenase